MERAVGPVERLGAMTLGGAQGWDGFGPLALGTGHRQIVLFQTWGGMAVFESLEG